MINGGYSQRDCQAFVNKKLEYTVTDIKENGQATSGYTELEHNGTIATFDNTGTKLYTGNYTLTEADNDQECFMEIEWDNGNPYNSECVTFSPTLNHLAMNGCFVFNERCVPECNITVLQQLGQWYSAIIIGEMGQDQ